jgi:hypothetical protein
MNNYSVEMAIMLMSGDYYSNPRLLQDAVTRDYLEVINGGTPDEWYSLPIERWHDVQRWRIEKIRALKQENKTPCLPYRTMNANTRLILKLMKCKPHGWKE